MNASAASSTERAKAEAGGTPWWDLLRAWVTARIAWTMAFVAANAIADSRQLNVFERAQLDGGLTIWDGDFYRRIAELGYGYTPRGALRFFPAFPALGRLVAAPFGLPLSVVLPVLSNGLAFVAMWLLWTYTNDVTGDERLARSSVWFLALYPAAGALIMAYAESLTLCLGLGSLVLLRRGSAGWATFLAVLAGAARPTAWLFSVVVVVDLLYDLGWLRPRDVDTRAAGSRQQISPLARIAVAIGPFAGTASYLVWVHRTQGDWFEPIRIQSELRGGLQDPLTRTFEAVRDLLTNPGQDVINLAFLAAFVAAIVAGYRRLPRSWTALSVATVVVAMSSQNIDSIGRYGLASFPLTVGLGVAAESEQSNRETLLALCGAGLVALGAMTFIGGYVP